MNINDTVESMKFDLRLLSMMLAKGLISEADYQKHISALPDVSNNLVNLDFDSDSDEDEPI